MNNNSDKLSLFRDENEDSTGFVDLNKNGFKIIESGSINSFKEVIFNNSLSGDSNNIKSADGHCGKINVTDCALNIVCVRRYLVDCSRYRII